MWPPNRDAASFVSGPNLNRPHTDTTPRRRNWAKLGYRVSSSRSRLEHHSATPSSSNRPAPQTNVLPRAFGDNYPGFSRAAVEVLFLVQQVRAVPVNYHAGVSAFPSTP